MFDSNRYCRVPLRSSNCKPNNENSKTPFPGQPLPAERKDEWLTQIQRDEGPQCKGRNRVDCGKHSLAFDLVTLPNAQCRSATQRLLLLRMTHWDRRGGLICPKMRGHVFRQIVDAD